MKKFLIGTTALVAAGFVAGQAQAADPIKLSVGGFMNQWVGYSDNENDTTVADGVDYSEVGTYSDSEIHFTGSTKLDNGLTVGVYVQTETSGGAASQDNTFLRISSDTLGQLDLGRTNGAATPLAHKHGDVGIGLGDTDATQFVQDSLALDLDTTASTNDGHKVVYLTPNFGGVQAGFSYGLHRDVNVGHADKRTADNDIQYNAAIAYNGSFSGVSIGADVGYETIKDGGITGVDVADENNIRYGLQVGVAGFTVAAAYQDVENNDNEAKADAKKWEVGVKYATGPYAVSLGYLNVKEEDNTTAGDTGVQDDEAKLWVASGSYDMGAGVSVAASVFSLENDDADATAQYNANDADNWGVAAGIKVNF